MGNLDIAGIPEEKPACPCCKTTGDVRGGFRVWVCNRCDCEWDELTRIPMWETEPRRIPPWMRETAAQSVAMSSFGGATPRLSTDPRRVPCEIHGAHYPGEVCSNPVPPSSRMTRRK